MTENNQLKPLTTIDADNIKLTDVIYLTDENCKFTAGVGGFVMLDFDGKHYDRVDFFRAFPFSEPDKFISVREPYGKHREIGIINDIAELSSDAAELIREQMELRYFTPKISRVYSARDKQGYSTLDVETDRGRCKFTIRGGTNAVTRLNETRLIFTDIEGNRFEISDVSALSKKEQKRIDLYI